MNRREKLAAAGQWLRAQRERRSLSARDLAARLDVLPQTLYAWEAGKSGVDNETAEQIAEILGIDEIEARRNLGLWVPKSRADSEAATDWLEQQWRKYKDDPGEKGVVLRGLLQSWVEQDEPSDRDDQGDRDNRDGEGGQSDTA